MGTNYHFYTGKKRRETCSLGHIHLVPESYHIGKSSMGRYFTLHREKLEDGTVLDSVAAWKAFTEKFKKGYIEDEYGRSVTPDEMWKLVTREDYQEKPGWKKLYGKPVDGPVSNYSMRYDYYDEYGEKGLVKSHGTPVGTDGLYVLFDGDFS